MSVEENLEIGCHRGETRIQEAYLGMRAAADDSSPDEAPSKSAPDGASRVG